MTDEEDCPHLPSQGACQNRTPPATDFHSASSLPARSNVSAGQGATYSYSATLNDPVWTITVTGTVTTTTKAG